MNENIPRPTPYQKRLVDIAFIIQFYLAALGHFVFWWFAYSALIQPPPTEGPDEGRIVVEVAFYLGIPISFGVLVAVYILFRCLLAYAKFTTALKSMILLNIIHSVAMFFVYITPLRLLIPTILYGIAYHSYWKEFERGLAAEPKS